MARLHERQSSVASSTPVTNLHTRQPATRQLSPALSELAGSDKENAGRGGVRTSLGKRKSTSNTMSSPHPTVLTSNKRRRVEDKGRASTSQRSRRGDVEHDTEIYDPDQDESMKRENTKKLRQLHTTLNDSRAEFLQRNSRGLQNTLKEADEIFRDVKQTSTATIDSRLLVNVGDLAYRKINTLTLGDSSTTIDVDDFLTKCISHMRAGPADGATQPTSTQRRRQQQRRNDDDDEEDEEEELDLNWSHFGRTLCFPASSRPCLSSFLLGPLSVQKKVRAPSQRRATQRTNLDPTQTTRPIALDEEALNKNESASLTQICAEIATLLSRTQARGEKLVEEQGQIWEDEEYEPSENEVRELMRKHNMSNNGGVPMFNFCLNPLSFGQTVENFFYISFLIKEGKVGLAFDDDEMPTLSMVEAKSLAERQESVRNQAVFKLDFDIWEELVKSCGIERCVIPHRQVEAFEADDGVLRHNVMEPRGEAAENTSRSRPGVRLLHANGEMSEDDDLYGPGQ